MGYSSVSFDPTLVAINSDAASSALAEANVASAAAVVAQSKASDASSAAATKMPTGDYSLTYADPLAIDWSNGSTQYTTLTGSPTLSTPSNPVNGQVYRLRLIQDATGSRTVTWWAGIIWAGGSAPTLTTTASKQDIITLLYSNGVYYADITKNF